MSVTEEGSKQELTASDPPSRIAVKLGRDLTPEHTKRIFRIDHDGKGEVSTEIVAAWRYLESVLDTSDFKGEYAWYGWALREAFLAGISYARGNPLTAEEANAILWEKECKE